MIVISDWEGWANGKSGVVGRSVAVKPAVLHRLFQTRGDFSAWRGPREPLPAPRTRNAIVQSEAQRPSRGSSPARRTVKGNASLQLIGEI